MIKIERPHIQFFSSYMDFINEMDLRGETVWKGMVPSPGQSPTDFVNSQLRAETEPPPGLVPETTYWAVEGEEVVGRISFRHTLNENLKEFGGHIGYDVRPTARRRGVATAMLRLLLQTPKVKKTGHVLLTCAPDNEGSIRTILANGGVLQETKYVAKWNRDTSYYWIDMSGK